MASKSSKEVKKEKPSKIIKEKDTNGLINETSGIQEEESSDTEVYDEADIASAVERGFLAQALAKQREKVQPESHPDFDGKHCVDCEADIPKKRLEWGRVRCVDCQEALEELARRKKI